MRPVRAAGVGLVICDGGSSGALLEEAPGKEQVRRVHRCCVCVVCVCGVCLCVCVMVVVVTRHTSGYRRIRFQLAHVRILSVPVEGQRQGDCRQCVV